MPPKKSLTTNTLINKILLYSAINNTANPTPPYSTLKPETSSDSPSAKSKGARCVSATQETNHINNIKKLTKKTQTNNWYFINILTLILPTKIRQLNKIKDILTS